MIRSTFFTALVVVLVGALNVGSISTPWSGEIRPRKSGVVETIDLAGAPRAVSKGDLLFRIDPETYEAALAAAAVERLVESDAVDPAEETVFRVITAQILDHLEKYRLRNVPGVIRAVQHSVGCVVDGLFVLGK